MFQTRSIHSYYQYQICIFDILHIVGMLYFQGIYLFSHTIAQLAGSLPFDSHAPWITVAFLAGRAGDPNAGPIP